MGADVVFVTGLLLVVLSLPACVSAYADARAPWRGLVLAGAGAGALGWAAWANPGAYRPGAIADVLVNVVAAVIN